MAQDRIYEKETQIGEPNVSGPSMSLLAQREIHLTLEGKGVGGKYRLRGLVTFGGIQGFRGF
jgi:hypothetical protein